MTYEAYDNDAVVGFDTFERPITKREIRASARRRREAEEHAAYEEWIEHEAWLDEMIRKAAAEAEGYHGI